MKKLTIALISVLALSSSFAFAKDGGDRTHARSMEHMKSVMESQKSSQSQVSTTQK